MKRIIKISFMLALVSILCVCNVQAQIVWDGGYHEFSEGYEAEIGMINGAIADITGGEIGQLLCYDTSSVRLYESGYVDFMKAIDSSSVTIYGGSVNILAAKAISDTSVYGGSLNIIEALDASTIDLFVQTYQWNPTGGQFQDGLLTGTWMGSGDSFSIELLGPETIEHILFVPEPSSAILFVIGSLILGHSGRKK